MTLDVSRRGFLLGFSAAGIVAAALPLAVEALAAPEAWIDREMGFAIPFTGRWDRLVEGVNGWSTMIDEVCQRAIIPSARKHLPPGTRYDIRLYIPNDYGRSRGVAWYHTPDMALREPWGYVKLPGEEIRWVEAARGLPAFTDNAVIAELTT